MGNFFKSTKSVLLQESEIVSDIVYTLVIAFLSNSNEEYADEIMEVAETAMEVIKDTPVGVDESVFHDDIEQVFGKWLNKQDILVQAALDRLFHKAFGLLSEKLDSVDVDDVINEDEKKAWLNLFQSIYDAAKMTMEYNKNKK